MIIKGGKECCVGPSEIFLPSPIYLPSLITQSYCYFLITQVTISRLSIRFCGLVANGDKLQPPRLISTKTLKSQCHSNSAPPEEVWSLNYLALSL